MSEPEDKDQHFQDYLHGDSELSRAYRSVSTETPPAHLDARIRSQARRAVRGPRHAWLSPFGRDWTTPLVLAAVLVLAIGLIRLLPTETGEPLVPTATGPLESDAEAPALPAPPAGGSHAPARDVQIQSTGKPGVSREQTPAFLSPSAPSHTFEQRATPHSAAKKRSVELRRGKQAPAGISMESKPYPREFSTDTLSRTTREQDSVQDTEPETWLRQIETLFQQGKQLEAEQSLRAFRIHHPAYPLPESLRGEE